MEAGRLRHRVVIQSLAETQDGATGAITESWSTLATVWAAIEPLSGREFIAAAESGSEVVARIVMRHRSDVTAKMRIVDGSMTYNIQAVLPDLESGTEYMTLPVTQGRNDA